MRCGGVLRPSLTDTARSSSKIPRSGRGNGRARPNKGMNLHLDTAASAENPPANEATPGRYHPGTPRLSEFDIISV
jgi:hypothetical protein